MLQQAITNTLEINEKTECLSKEIENIKRSQVEILEPKHAITKIKNSLCRSIAD